MSRMQREKGKRFERVIAGMLRERFPLAEIRRASQAERAYQSDVFATGHDRLARCWLELTDARSPNPVHKLEQAEGDVQARHETRLRLGQEPNLWPVVVWHRIGERHVSVTMRTHTLVDMLGFCDRPTGKLWLNGCLDTPITMTLDRFVDIVDLENCEHEQEYAA